MYRILSLVLLLISYAARADFNCEVDLQLGVLVNDHQIRVIQDNRTLYQINGDDQLIVKGDWLKLNPQQAADLKELSDGIHYAMPKMILLATEGVQQAIKTVENVYTGLVGQDHNSYQRLKTALKRVQYKVSKKYVHAGNNYYIGPRSIENVDVLVDAKMEAQIEHAVNTSLGGILSAIGGLEGDGKADKDSANLSGKLGDMGVEIEKQVTPKSQNLRKKARWFCEKMKQLDKVEERLRQQVPQLQPYNVIVTGHADGSSR